ncbi:MAG: peroxiredoxin family protein [Thermodesulfobacteriota bacterium]
MIKKLPIILIAFILFAGVGCEPPDPSVAENFLQPVEEGKPGPDFLVKDLKGGFFRLSEHRNEVVMLFFWRMKFKDNTDLLPALEELHQRYQDKGLTVLAVSAETMHSVTLYAMRDFIEENGYTFTVIRDVDGIVSEAYRVLRGPSTYVIDSKGVLVFIQQGPIDWLSEENVGMIEGLLEERAEEPEKT